MVRALPFRIALIVAILCIAVTPAGAQSSDPPALSVAGGAGIAFPFHSDFSSNPVAWHGSVRVRATKYVLVEGLYEQWRDTQTLVTTDLTLRNAVGASIGHVDELRSEDATTVSVAGLNVLVSAAVGRARISAGGGPGVLTYRDRYEVSLTGCTAQDPRTCDGYVRRDARHAFAVQGAVDLDVPVTRRLSLFGRGIAAGPVDDPGAGYAAIVGGLRFSVF